VLYGQYGLEFSHEAILWGLKELGFDEVVEVAEGSEIVSLAIAAVLKQPAIKRPVISSSCPAVIRLIQVKFPELIDHIVPVDPPEEVIARKIRATKKNAGLTFADVGIWFITPCPAKMTAVMRPLGLVQSNFTGAIAISKIYGELFKAIAGYQANAQSLASTWIGVGYKSAGGEKTAFQESRLVVHDIHNVMNILEQVALGKLNDVEYIECLACATGCLGGALTVENCFVAKHRLRERLRMLCERDAWQGQSPRLAFSSEEVATDNWLPITPLDVMKLDEDIIKAMHKVETIDKTLRKLPGLDCGSCGSPTCKVLAEDIAQGTASEMDCIFTLREKVKELAEEMIALTDKMPSSQDRKTEK
jgi:ferredoxin